VSNLKGNIKLLNVQDGLRDLLQMTRLCTLFETYDDEAEAVRSFGAAARA
jgi:anti-sigma B factor antagonist